MRCVHEAELHEDNCFLTLTYDDAHLPDNGGLNKRHFQLFMKKLRKSIAPKKVRYYMCGEYGEATARPHYHAIIFGHWFTDQAFLFNTANGHAVYTSPTLRKLWKYGHVTMGTVTFESAAYVARYIMKKVTGEKAEEHYKRVDPDTGEVHSIAPEYTAMSRRPGIGRDWYDKYADDVFPSDTVVMRGQPMRPPRFYDNLYADADVIKAQRKKEALKHSENNTTNRLRVREEVTKARTGFLTRKVD